MATYYRLYEAVRDSDDAILGLIYTDKFFEDEAAAVVVIGASKFGTLDADDNVVIS